jgi:tetratricopeptide (TPR) repeat protein
VENGGGLLLLADRDAPHESITSYFGVQFCSQQVVIADKTAETFSDSVRQFFITDIRDHPVTKNVNQIALNEGVPILEYGSGEVLAQTSENSWIDKFSEGKTDTKESDEDEGSYAVLVVQTIKKGRTVFFGCAGSFFNWVVDEPDQQNLELLANAVKWLGEPGGPYKQYRTLNDQAQQVMQTAQSLYEENSFSEAETEFKKSEDLFEESNEIYPNSTAEEGIQEAETYIEKCETGLEADEIFEKAEALYTAREYEKAIEEYGKAKLLYEEIGYTERAQTCNTRTEESNNQIALREEATRLFQEAEEALAAAPSTFDPSGYEKAQSLFGEARTTWEEYGDPGKVAACEENIDLCTEEISKIKNTTMIFIVGIIVVIVVVVVVIIVRRKPSAAIPPEPEEPVSEQEESLQEPKETPLEILKSRYQRGEITEEEYERLKLALKSD